MNIDNINRLADVIEKQDHTDRDADSGFNMNCFFHACGTPSCIAGWADELSGLPRTGEHSVDGCEARAAAWLELDGQHAYALFWAGNRDLRSITPTQAAAVLRHLAVTGDVDWSIGEPA